MSTSSPERATSSTPWTWTALGMFPGPFPSPTSSANYGQLFFILPWRATTKTRQGEEPSIEEVAAALSSMEIRLGAPSQAQEEAPPQRKQSKEAVASMVAQAASARQENIDDLQDDADTLGGVGALFCSPPAPLLQQPAVRRARPRSTVDMSNVRRSARLEGKPSIPAMQMAQRNLCRKLDIGNDELTSVEDTLRDSVAMFQGALPEQVVAAMTTIFGLDDDGTALLDDALLQHTPGRHFQSSHLIMDRPSKLWHICMLQRSLGFSMHFTFTYVSALRTYVLLLRPAGYDLWATLCYRPAGFDLRAAIVFVLNLKLSKLLSTCMSSKP